MKRQLKRGLIAMIGSLVLVAGIIMIPYPGPGWLVVFAGLSILATEFDWAKKVLEYAKSKYDVWVNWTEAQNSFIRIIIWLFTATIVVVTIWLVNGYGVIADILGIHCEWVQSPFVH